MIKINLLPQDMAGGAKAPGSGGAAMGTVLVFAGLALLFAVNIGVGIYLFGLQSDAKQRLAELRREAAEIQEVLETTELEYNETRANLEYMNELVSVAEALAPEDRVLWSRKLNQLPDLVPEGVYLTEIDVTQNVQVKPTPESLRARNEHIEEKKSGPPPPLEEIPVYTQTLRLAGVAYVQDGTDTQRLEQITSFARNIMNRTTALPYQNEEASFMDGMLPRLVPSSVTGRQLQGRAVSQFNFTLTTQPMEVR